MVDGMCRSQAAQQGLHCGRKQGQPEYPIITTRQYSLLRLGSDLTNQETGFNRGKPSTWVCYCILYKIIYTAIV